MTQEQTVRERLPSIVPRMRRMARALTAHAEDADDLVQIALERALTRAGQWRPEERLDTWVFAILRNAWLDELRSRSRWSRVMTYDEALAERADDPVAELRIEAIAVGEALARLPVEQREVVALVMVEGLAYREAADVLGLPIGTVTSRLARARTALQGWLGEA